MPFPMPRWLEEMEDGPEKDRARSRFLVRLAALYHTADGFPNQLSVSIGLHYHTLNGGMTRWTVVPASIAWKIQETLGKDLFPASAFNPIFASEE